MRCVFAAERRSCIQAEPAWSVRRCASRYFRTCYVSPISGPPCGSVARLLRRAPTGASLGVLVHDDRVGWVARESDLWGNLGGLGGVLFDSTLRLSLDDDLCWLPWCERRQRCLTHAVASGFLGPPAARRNWNVVTGTKLPKTSIRQPVSWGELMNRFGPERA